MFRGISATQKVSRLQRDWPSELQQRSSPGFNVNPLSLQFTARASNKLWHSLLVVNSFSTIKMCYFHRFYQLFSCFLGVSEPHESKADKIIVNPIIARKINVDAKKGRRTIKFSNQLRNDSNSRDIF